MKLVIRFGMTFLHVLLVFPYLKQAIKLKQEKWLAFMHLVLWWSTCNHVQAAINSLKPGDTLDYRTSLNSANEKYYLAFGGRIVKKNYLAVFNEKFDIDIWIGNRNQPVPDPNFAVLLLDHSGVLKIESEADEENPIILYSPPQAINNTVATLLDTGNFVLQQVHANGTKTLLWQSFDYPTDTLMPTMKLGVNHKTNHHWSLVSFFTYKDEFSGVFSLEWESTEQELVIRRRRQVSWRSGKLRNNNRFEHIPEDVQSMMKYIVVSNRDESSFSFTSTTDDEAAALLISAEGGIRNLEERTLVSSDMCDGYNYTGGCQRWEPIPKCRNRSDAFEKYSGHYGGDGAKWSEPNATYGMSDCQAICWSNCTCIGFKKLYYDGTGCIFFSEKAFTIDPEGVGEEVFMLGNQTHHDGNMGKSTTNSRPTPGKKKWIWIIAIIASALFLICLSIMCITLKKRKDALQEKKKKEMVLKMSASTTCNESSAIKDFEADLEKRHGLKVFDYTSVMTATNGFSSENKLGQGGFGPVYKGILPTKQEVAVKRLSKTSSQGIMEFKNELTLICELQHMNLVQLLGCCIHEEEKILIYEYMPNKSLDFYLFDRNRSKLLEWKKRFNIIDGISQGILYLHKYSRLKVIHRDLKASNILLDENMNPKISDFGMARMFTQQESVSNTNRVVGTFGYMSPEYAMEGVFSTKSDVYSFGVLLLEIISGRRNTSFYDVDHPLNLIGYAWELWKDGVCLQLVDPSLNESFDPDEVQRCIHVGLLCVEQYPNDRPTMSDIISMLTNKSAIVSLPQRPAFYVQRDILDEKLSSKEMYTVSTEEITSFLET